MNKIDGLSPAVQQKDTMQKILFLLGKYLQDVTQLRRFLIDTSRKDSDMKWT